MGKKKRGRSVKKVAVKKKTTKKKAAKKKAVKKKTAKKKTARKKPTPKKGAKKKKKKSATAASARQPPPRIRDASALERQTVPTLRTERERPAPQRGRSSRRRHSQRSPREPKLGGKKPKFSLAELTSERQAEIDALLVRVYVQAAKDLRELEQREVDATRTHDAKVAENYEKARREIMRTLTRWEQRKKDD